MELSLVLTTLTIVTFISTVTSQSPIQNFVSCFSKFHEPSHSPITEVIYTPNNKTFSTILNKHLQNKRFKLDSTPKPLAIVTAKSAFDVQATVKCAKSNNIQIRIRSGGHDYEGYSYVSDVPFIILDMFLINGINIDKHNKVAWVESGATLGKLYYTIGKTSNFFGFPAGVCFSLGIGGHFSGGGYGNLMRKFGLSVDNIVDAKIVDVNGNILDRKAMGEDLFWAITGGGGASFGVILSWKIKLVYIPSNVTVFDVSKTLEEGAIDLIYKWQLIATKLPNELFIRLQPIVKIGKDGKKVVQVHFIGQFLGTTEKLLPLINEKFHELGLKTSDCHHMPWVNSTLFWYGKPIGTPLEALLDEPKDTSTIYFKSQSDYVKKPIPKEGIKAIFEKMIEGDTLFMQWNPYGGRMDEISASAKPFPHRKGNLFLIQYLNYWPEDTPGAIERHVNFSRSFLQFMTPYVSHSPREAFFNYRDADIGANLPSNVTKMGISKVYGTKYFKDNFNRLVNIKTKVDPHNFFRYEQSIPTLSAL
ncbi:berberine bridge enzyme-like 17 [Cicer arietinum]|uniref:Berberine bridge enzyme-like 17 n=1 Tax=Cicer arietinum TaxID=3827 RepID=A0A1S2YHU3_CICAR|nr:berberine bridge enzyme-like 17 [Cicer arietinum]